MCEPYQQALLQHTDRIGGYFFRESHCRGEPLTIQNASELQTLPQELRSLVIGPNLQVHCMVQHPNGGLFSSVTPHSSTGTEQGEVIEDTELELCLWDEMHVPESRVRTLRAPLSATTHLQLVRSVSLPWYTHTARLTPNPLNSTLSRGSIDSQSSTFLRGSTLPGSTLPPRPTLQKRFAVSPPTALDSSHAATHLASSALPPTSADLSSFPPHRPPHTTAATTSPSSTRHLIPFIPFLSRPTQMEWILVGVILLAICMFIYFWLQQKPGLTATTTSSLVYRSTDHFHPRGLHPARFSEMDYPTRAVRGTA